MLLMEERIRFDDDVFLSRVLNLVQRNEFSTLERLADFRIDAYVDFLAVEQVRHLFDLLLDLIADGLRRFRPTCPVTVGTWPADGPFERRLSPLARNRDEAEIIELKNLRGHAIGANGL